MKRIIIGLLLLAILLEMVLSFEKYEVPKPTIFISR